MTVQDFLATYTQRVSSALAIVPEQVLYNAYVSRGGNLNARAFADALSDRGYLRFHGEGYACLQLVDPEDLSWLDDPEPDTPIVFEV